MNSTSTNIPLIWNDSVEQILSKYSNVSKLSHYLHYKSHVRYKKINYLYTIPSIILSTLSGFISMSLTGFNLSDPQMNVANICLGSINILTGILTTLNNSFKNSELSAEHLNLANSFQKLYTNIDSELNLERDKRKDVNVFFQSSKNEYIKLLENSPPFKKITIRNFLNKTSLNFENDVPSIINNKFHKIDINTENVSNSSEIEKVDSAYSSH